MLSGRRSASTAAEKGETLANCSNSIGKESTVLQSCRQFILIDDLVQELPVLTSR